MPLRLVDEVANATLTASATHRLGIPNDTWLAAVNIHADITVSVASGAITIVNSTLGAIPLLKKIGLYVEGSSAVFEISGKYLDLWSKIDRPGSERVADSNTVTANPWDTDLRYELAQSEGNPIGAIPLWLYQSATLVVETDAVTAIGTGTTPTVAGTLRLVAERYHAASRFSLPGAADPRQANLAVAAVVHRLTSFREDFSGTGERSFRLKGYDQELLERLIVVANNNAADDWALFDVVALMRSNDETLQRLRAEQMRARNLRNYGGENMPATGAWCFDMRRAGDADVIAVGGAVAPDLHVKTSIPSGTSLTSAYADFIVETMQRVNRDPARVLAPSGLAVARAA